MFFTGIRISASGAYRPVHAVLVFSTRSRWSRQTKCSPALRTSAPGSSPASQRIWKPLQMPRTGMPRCAASTTSTITGANRAIAPARR